MICDFRDKRAQRIFEGSSVPKLPNDIQRVTRRKLRMLNAAHKLDDLRVPPGNRLEALKGSRRGQYSIRVNDQWRLCFKWKNGDVHDVEIVDYHKG